MSGGADEKWVESAMKDDTMAAKLLVQLQNRTPQNPLKWTIRQPRSNPKKSSQRGSPTTPLSWSGGGGDGGAATSGGGFEESSPLSTVKLSNNSRSKVDGVNEKTASKRSRKKKTLSELKEEENLLMKERRDLKREIASLRVNLEKQSATNESLKRIKLELVGNNDVKLQRDEPSNSPFVLPDLNLPLEDSISDVICGVS